MTKLNVNKQPMIFNVGDLVSLHLHKDRFPNERKSKLLPRADGPSKVLACYNNNAYKIDIPRDKYSITTRKNTTSSVGFLHTSSVGSCATATTLQLQRYS